MSLEFIRFPVRTQNTSCFMKEVVEFLKDATQSVIDRLRFPLFNSFLISWFVLNWKPIFLVLFEDWPMHVKVEYVSIHHSNLLFTLILPLSVATFYVVGTPFL